MFRDLASKIAWVGRTASMVFGLALVLALLLGIATMALAAVPGDPFKLGQVNRINDALTTLVGSRSGSMMAVDNDSTAANARALDLRVETGRTPMMVPADAGKATHLNADRVDGQEASDLAESRGYAHIKPNGDVNTDFPHRGVIDVVIPAGETSVYCFDLTFTPKAAVGSSHPNNNVVIGTETPDNPPRSDAASVTCDSPHNDAVAHIWSAEPATPEEEEPPVNFQIVFE